jgi:hypothetical protein
MIRTRTPGRLLALAGALVGALPSVRAQDLPPTRRAIQAAAGAGVHAGREEKGLGLLFALGYEQDLGARARWRLNPQLVYGEFSSAGITDTRDQFYRTTAAGVALHYDVLKYRALAVVVSAGGFVTYARGLLGTGGELQPVGQGSRYFTHFYGSASAGLGLRVSPAGSRLAYEVRPLTLHGGSAGFALGYATAGLALQLNK